MATFVCIDRNGDQPLSVHAESAQDAAKQVVGSGPYRWAKLPRNWQQAKPVTVRASDIDGSTSSVRVYGPL